MAPALPEPHPLDDRARSFPCIFHAGEFQRQHDVLERVQRRHEVKRLEYEADAVGTHARTPILVELAEVHTVQYDITFRGKIQPGEQREQRRFARPRRSDDGHGFSRGDRETNVGKNSQTALGAANLFADIVCRKNGAIV